MVKSYNNYDKEKDKVQNRLNKYGIFLGPRGPLGTPLSVRVSVRTKVQIGPNMCYIFENVRAQGCEIWHSHNYKKD